MLYFIPAWYKQNMWCENEQQWYIRRLKSEFDETIKQITLFHRNVDRPYRILVLGYSPNFRHFLHRQGMYRSKYWSCLDVYKRQDKNYIAYKLNPVGATPLMFASAAFLLPQFMCNGLHYLDVYKRQFLMHMIVMMSFMLGWMA